MTEPESFEIIYRGLKSVLKPKRFNHSIGVEYTAACLAMKYGEDIEKARYAGILHDCAKYMSGDQIIAFCKRNNISLTEEEINAPKVIHAIAGVFIAEKLYKIEDENILKAIRFHCTGKADMSMLEKIIFVSDYIEPNRTDIPDLYIIRQTAFSDIDKAVYLILNNTVNFLNGEDNLIVSDTLKAFEFYSERVRNG